MMQCSKIAQHLAVVGRVLHSIVVVVVDENTLTHRGPRRNVHPALTSSSLAGVAQHRRVGVILVSTFLVGHCVFQRTLSAAALPLAPGFGVGSDFRIGVVVREALASIESCSLRLAKATNPETTEAEFSRPFLNS
jgi:hypothetical protein